MLRRALATLALVFTPAFAHADVGPPPGLKYMDVKHTVQGSATIPETHTLALVTTRHSERQYLRVRWSGFEGAVDVPSGYMLSTRFVALTEDQLVQLATLYAKALPEGDATRRALEAASPEAVAALMAKTEIVPGSDLAEVASFFAREDLATSPVLAYRTTVAAAFDGPHVTESWRIEGLKDGRIAMVAAVAEKTSGERKGCTSGADPSTFLAVVSLLLLLGGRHGRSRRIAR